jgi:hypothetical protein
MGTGHQLSRGQDISYPWGQDISHSGDRTSAIQGTGHQVSRVQDISYLRGIKSAIRGLASATVSRGLDNGHKLQVVWEHYVSYLVTF